MKYIIFALLLCGMAACSSEKDTPSDSDNICCGANPSQMVFKTHGGREFVMVGEVTSVDIKVNQAPGNPPVEGLERTFTGNAAKTVVGKLYLAYPQPQNGAPMSMETGRILIHYVHPGMAEGIREISIQNSSLLQDPVFPEVTYNPNLTMDRAWLESQ